MMFPDRYTSKSFLKSIENSKKEEKAIRLLILYLMTDDPSSVRRGWINVRSELSKAVRYIPSWAFSEPRRRLYHASCKGIGKPARITSFAKSKKGLVEFLEGENLKLFKLNADIDHKQIDARAFLEKDRVQEILHTENISINWLLHRVTKEEEVIVIYERKDFHKILTFIGESQIWKGG